MGNNGSTAVASRVKVVQPGEGRLGGLVPGVGVVFKIDGRDSGGALSIVEHPFAVGALVPPHIHTLEDEFSIVLEGQIGFRSEDQEVVLAAGEVHAMWNAGPTPARMIEVISPAGFEDFFRDFADLTDKGAPSPEQVAEIAARYQLPFAQPEWLPDVIKRSSSTLRTRSATNRVELVIWVLRRLDLVEELAVDDRLSRGGDGRQDLRGARGIGIGSSVTPEASPQLADRVDLVGTDAVEERRLIEEGMTDTAVAPVQQRQRRPPAADIAGVEVAVDERVRKPGRANRFESLRQIARHRRAPAARAHASPALPEQAARRPGPPSRAAARPAARPSARVTASARRTGPRRGCPA